MREFLWLALLGVSIMPRTLAEPRQLLTPKQTSPLGHVRYTLANENLKDVIPHSEILSVSPHTVEFIAPVKSMMEIERLAVLSHAATHLCGSIDYYPAGYTLSETITHRPPHFSSEARFPSLSDIIAEADLTRINQTIDTLTLLPTRYHLSTSGRNAGSEVSSIWTQQLGADTGGRVTIELIAHAESITPQKSVVAKLKGASEETVILGAHLDSITNASLNSAETPAPGADDDASGIAILTEILRIVEKRKMTFHRSIEFHAYAAEEAGLRGSRDLASSYKKAGRDVAGMMQFDMAYYSRAEDYGRIYFLSNYTSLDLLRNNVGYLKHYLGDVYDRGELPQGTASDHKAWWEQGYPTLFPFENPKAYNPFIHTSSDEKDQFDDGLRMKRLVQLGLLFLSYHAGLTSLDAEAEAETKRLKTEGISKDMFLNLEGSGGSYDLRASAPLETTYLEICETTLPGDFRCSGERLALEESEETSGRKIFSTSLKFSAGQIYRVEAYDANDALLERRHIKLNAK